MISRFILFRSIEFGVLNEQDGYKFFASKNKQLIAWAYLRYSESKPHQGWWIWSLRVKLLYRRLGIGKQLIKNIIKFLRRKDAHVLHLNVHKENLPALELFGHLGFTIGVGSERFDHNSQPPFACMQKRLDGYED